MMPGFAITFLIVVTIAATAIGTLIVRRGFAFRHEAVGWAVSTATGLLILSAVVFLLALAGQATAGHLRVVFAILALTAVTSLVRSTRRVRTHGAAAFYVRPWMAWCAFAGVAYLTWMVLVAMLPPVATDELNHHLAVPRTMLAEGGRVVFRDNIYALLPAPRRDAVSFRTRRRRGDGRQALSDTVRRRRGRHLVRLLPVPYLPAGAAVWPVAIFFTVPTVMVNLPTAYVDVILPRMHCSRC